MARIGYVRVSKYEQHEALQVDALKAAGCEQLFTDKGVTGKKAERKALLEALAYLRPGDVFIVWKLDRAGRSLKHLIELLNTLQTRGIAFVSITDNLDTTTPGGKFMFHMLGALAEFEHDLIHERTQAGLAAARARGRKGGRPKKVKSDPKIALARRLYDEKKHTIAQICSLIGVSRPTLYRYLRGDQAEAAKAGAGQEKKE